MNSSVETVRQVPLPKRVKTDVNQQVQQQAVTVSANEAKPIEASSTKPAADVTKAQPKSAKKKAAQAKPKAGKLR